jgi:hypothetical protein
MTVSRVTIANPADHVQIKLLPFMKYLKSGWPIAWSSKSGWLEKTSSVGPGQPAIGGQV